MTIAYWQAWFAWVQATSLALAKKGDLVGLTAFLGDLGTTLQLLIPPFEGLAECFKGSLFSIAAKVYQWAKANPDPIGPFRRAANDMRTKWSKALASPPIG